MALIRFIHLFTFTFWYGTLLYFTFIQAPILFKTLPRETFGLVQSKLFPPYYLIAYICGTLLVVTYALLHPFKGWTGQDGLKMASLCLMLLGALGQGLWIGPKVAGLRIERMEAEKAKDGAKVEAISKEFGKAHGISSLINLLVVLAGLVYLIYFSKSPHPPADLLKGIF